METSGTVEARPWSDVAEAWEKAEQAKASALEGISQAAVAVGMVGRLLLGYRHQCDTQREFEALVSQCAPMDLDTAKRCMAVHERIATKQIDTADHASVRQLLLDVGLMPPPEPGLPAPPQNAPWWSRMTSKIDARLGRMSTQERAGLRLWCETMLQRLAR